MQPHHDGSVLYVKNQSPRLGEHVSVLARIPADWTDVTGVHVRSLRDAEPHYDTATQKHDDGTWLWYEASVTATNPSTKYRWLIQRGQGTDARNVWLNATGVHTNDVPDYNDFRLITFERAPEWIRDQVMYQIFPDRFARSAAADERQLPEWAIACDWNSTPVVPRGDETPRQFYGGDLAGIEEHLDHVQSLGVTLLYLTPMFPAGSNHRYDASTFTRIDELLGGDEALVSLVRAAHERGLKVIGDLTTNHSGDKHEWFTDSHGNPSSEYSDFYYYLDAQNQDYVSWLGVPSLPKFDWKSEGLRRKFFLDDDSVLCRWLQEPFNLDGWRIDVGNMTGRMGADDLNHEVAALVRNRMNEVKPGAMLVAESTSDAAPDFAGDTWDGAMTYTNFTRPLWQWLSAANTEDPAALSYFGLPQSRPDAIDAEAFLRTHLEFLAAFPWQVRLNNMNALDTHDTARIANAVGNELLPVAIGLQFTLPGMPVLFAGDEFGLRGINGEDSRTPMPWDDESRRLVDLRETYAHYAKLRRENRALVEGAVRWIHAEGDALLFARELPRENAESGDVDALYVLAARRATSFEVDPREIGLPAGDPVLIETRGPELRVSPSM